MRYRDRDRLRHLYRYSLRTVHGVRLRYGDRDRLSDRHRDRSVNCDRDSPDNGNRDWLRH
jgi:hypothetical protein